MSTLQSALDELRAEDRRTVADEGLVADLDELERASRVLKAERLRRLAEFERRGGGRSDYERERTAWSPRLLGRSRPSPNARSRTRTVGTSEGASSPAATGHQAGATRITVRRWADGGETSLANLVLLCRPHHRAIHRGFGIQMVGGSPVFSRPDGTTLGDRAPP